MHQKIAADAKNALSKILSLSFIPVDKPLGFKTTMIFQNLSHPYIFRMTSKLSPFWGPISKSRI